MVAKHSITELNQLFLDGESADQELFAEQRSNLQIIAGNHYTRKGSKFHNRIRESKDIPQEQKIRLTKNHVRKIVLTYRNSITNYAPGVKAVPKDKTSLQNQKTSELVNSVWEDAKAKHDMTQKINQWANDYVGIGEVAAKIFWNPMAGKFLGTEAEVDENGQVILDENGQPIPSGVHRFTGDVDIERWFGFNIVRDAGAKAMKDSPWLCHRKMVQTKAIHALIDSNTSFTEEEKEALKKKVNDGPDQTYMVLDGNTGNYKNVKNETMLREYYFRKCDQYPNGYFYLTTNDAIIFEGELPFGIWPIAFEGFDEIQTSPRYRSIVKQLRPNQIEINRCASKMAEHQISLGDDKILVQNGTKIIPGVTLPGVRSFQYSGASPIVMEGRSGNQFLELMNQNITEMYQIAMLDEQMAEKPSGNFDAFAALYKSLKDKKKFSIYTDGFESFLKQVFKIYIQTAQKYFDDSHLIPAIGKSEYINISEFKNVDDLCYSVTLEPQTDDSESQLGTQLMLNHVIQYIGPQMAKDDLGKIIKLMPLGNDELILDGLTADYDLATNIMLALDRGQPMPEKNYSKPEYLIEKLVNRTMKPDFGMLGPQISALYDDAIAYLMDLKTQQQIAIKQAQSQFIPVGGYLVACDFYVPDPKNPEKLPKRVRIPSEALQWLLDQLASQGSDQETLAGLGQGALSTMSQMLMQKLQQASGGMGPSQSMLSQMGQTNPGGM